MEEKKKLKPEEMPEYKEFRRYIENMRIMFPDWSDERIIEELDYWGNF